MDSEKLQTPLTEVEAAELLNVVGHISEEMHDRVRRLLWERDALKERRLENVAMCEQLRLEQLTEYFRIRSNRV